MVTPNWIPSCSYVHPIMSFISHSPPTSHPKVFTLRIGNCKVCRSKNLWHSVWLITKSQSCRSQLQLCCLRHILTPSAARAVASVNSAMGRLISGCGCRIFKILTWKLNGELVCMADSSLSSFNTYNNTRMDWYSAVESWQFNFKRNEDRCMFHKIYENPNIHISFLSPSHILWICMRTDISKICSH